MFLDSHCEVNHRWLEPLLRALGTKKPTIAVPVIDSISPGSFEYTESKVMKGGFNWGLNFRWDEIPAEFYTGLTFISQFSLSSDVLTFF